MQDNDRKILEKFSDIMGGIALEYGALEYGKKLPKEMLRLKFNSLKKYSIKQVEKAAEHILQTRKITTPAMPTTKEFVDAIEGKKDDNEIKGDAQIQADLAVSALRRWGGPRLSTMFDDPVTNYLMTKKWNYKDLADKMMDNDFEKFRIEFIAGYKSYLKTPGIIDEHKKEIENKKSDMDMKTLSDMMGTSLDNVTKSMDDINIGSEKQEILVKPEDPKVFPDEKEAEIAVRKEDWERRKALVEGLSKEEMKMLEKYIQNRGKNEFQKRFSFDNQICYIDEFKAILDRNRKRIDNNLKKE